MGRIGAVSPLRRFAPALRSGEPRAWGVPMDGGSAKGAVGIDGRSDKFRFRLSPLISKPQNVDSVFIESSL